MSYGTQSSTCGVTDRAPILARNLAFCATVNSPTFEFLSPLLWDSPIRSELVRPEPAIRDGRMELPTGAGLGVELDEDALARYRVDQPRVTDAR